MSDFFIQIEGGETLLVKRREALGPALGRASDAVAVTLAGFMAEEAPVDVGRLASSINWKKFGATSAKVIAGSSKIKYALAVARGSRPHRIYPRRAKALAWHRRSGDPNKPYVSAKTGKPVKTKSLGATTVRRYVDHPGNKPNPFDVRAVGHTRKVLPSVVTRVLHSAGVLG